MEEWSKKRRAPWPADAASAITISRPMGWMFGTTPVAEPPKLVVVDPNAPQRTRQSLQQLAEIVNSLLRARVLVFTAAREFEIQYRPADLQDHPIGTPDTMDLWDALDRLASRVKALE